MARIAGAIAGAVLLSGTAAAAPPDPARQLVGKTAVMSIHIDPEGELDPALADAGYGTIQEPRDLPADGFPLHRIYVLSGGPDPKGDSTLVFWRLEGPQDRLKGEWKIVAAFRAKVGSESSMSTDCAGNGKDKAPVTLVFHEGGDVGQPVKKILAAFRVDRQSGKVDRVGGKPPACKATEEGFSEE
jgi:hypothetical protein